MMRGVVAFIVGVADLAGEIIARESISLRLANIAEHRRNSTAFARADRGRQSDPRRGRAIARRVV
jgi:hypothetical protein